MERNKVSDQVKNPSIDRRDFIATTVSAMAVTTLATSPLNLFFARTGGIKAIAFDAFAIFDPRPLFALAESMFSEKGKELNNVWRTKQFEYSWLRTVGNKYKNFREVTEDALIYAAKQTDVVLSNQNKKELMEQYFRLNTWTDVLPALEALKQNGIRLSFLSNMTREMLDSCIRYSKTENYFECVISTDSAKTYKPSPIAYQLGIDTLKLKKEEILFVAFAGWDASGAKWFGYPAFWLNRLSVPPEELNTIPDGIGKSMNDLADFIRQ
ncbi:MAG TPA: haloacid dehalogenase type II [Chitinophagaceae bacterium]|jgi:2-haloacid dehalogenase